MAEPKKINVIIADDSPTFQESLALMLNNENQFNILHTLKNGKELVDCKDLFKADVLLVDIEMPIMGGLEAASLISAEYRNLPIIALTMHQDKVYLVEMIESGFKAYIYKPNLADLLFEVIAKVLNNEFVFPDNLNIS